MKLSREDWRVLYLIERHGEGRDAMDLNTLAHPRYDGARLQATDRAMRNRLRRLEARGLLTSHAAAIDAVKPVVVFSLTDAGRAAVQGGPA